MSKKPKDQSGDPPQPMRTRRTAEPAPRETPLSQETPPVEDSLAQTPPRRRERAPHQARRAGPPPAEPASSPAPTVTPPKGEMPQHIVPAEPASAVPPPSPRESGLYFPWWSIVGLVAVVGLLSCGIWGLIYTSGGDNPPGGRTPNIIVITSSATPAMPTVPPTLITPTATPPPGPTATNTLPPSNITMEIGVTIEVVGTEGAGLSMRDGAGTGYERLYTAYDGEVLIVQDGPQFSGGYEWWYVVDPDDPNRAGWSVRRYMQAIAPPPEE